MGKEKLDIEFISSRDRNYKDWTYSSTLMATTAFPKQLLIFRMKNEIYVAENSYDFNPCLDVI